MPRTKTLTGRVITITETKGSDPAKYHWYIVSGTAEGVIDYLNEQGIPEHKVKGFHFASPNYYILFHK